MAHNFIQGETYRFTLLTDRLIRLEYAQDGRFEDRQTQLVQNRIFGDVNYTLKEHNDGHLLEIETKYFHLYYDGGEFAASNLWIDAKYQYTLHDSRWYFGEDEDGNLGGTFATLDHADGEIPVDTGIMSRNGYAYLDDTESFAIADNEFTQRVTEQVDGYFLAYGREYREALADFYKLSGKTPILPRFALGNWWSRYYKYTQDEYLKLMDDFDKERVPINVSVIDMDWHRTTDVPSRFGSTWTGYSWDRNLFPDPDGFLAELKKQHRHVTINTHPAGGIRAFEDSYPAVAKYLGLDIEHEEPAPFDLDNVKFRKAYFEKVHHPLEKQGIDFWWMDWQQGTSRNKEKVEPLWNLNHYHYLDNAQSHDGEGLILSRYAGPGSHRYPIGFSGDTFITWASLNFQPYFTSMATNIGYTWWSHDIGGHMKGSFDVELALRWIQYGVFSPINRLHSSDNPFSGKEPWKFREDVRQYMDNYLRLRGKLIPYLDSANIITNLHNRSLVEPMYYQYPDNTESYLYKNQYLFGSQLMVAPITTPQNQVSNTGTVDVWLPEGQWMDIFNDIIYQGDDSDNQPLASSTILVGQYKSGATTVKMSRTLANIPVLAKVGAIVPMVADPMQQIDELPAEIEVHVYGNANNAYTMYEHVGHAIAKTEITIIDGHFKTIIDDPNNIVPSDRQYRFKSHAFTVDGNSELILVGSDEKTVVVQDDNRQAERARQQLITQLQGAKIAYEEKREILDKIDNPQVTPLKLATYAQTLHDESLQAMVIEYAMILQSHH
ncbi:alpha-xylosidase [Weissella paramesenteroides]|nr:alpha-xylosidase [Weissella paramesenteroides]KAA8436743.1 alpha-xylosidase [Weissella paramesenteroides]